MKKFLSVFAQKLYEDHGHELTDCCIVFPNKRAGNFFLEYLMNVIKTPVIAPEILSISQFFVRYSSLVQTDPLTLIVRLYNSYRKINKNPETFDKFYTWGYMILKDFNDIDKQLVNAKDLFQNLVSLQKIENKFDYLSDEQIAYIQEFWSNFNPKSTSIEQQEFLNIWEILYPMYKDFRQKLVEENQAYEGMIYREVAEKVKNEDIDWKFSNIFFVGLNAMSRSTEIVLKHLQQKGYAQFCWDYDDYYVQNPYHKAGFFIRKNLQKFSNLVLDLSYNRFEKKDKKISFYSCNSETAQAKLLPDILDRQTERFYDDTVIVLANLHTVIPVIHSLPTHLEKYNISMGFPFIYTPTYDWLTLLIELQKKSRKKNNEYFFYYKNILAIFNHPYFADDEESTRLVIKIKENNEVFISQDKLWNNDFAKKIFQKPKDVNQLTNYLLDVLNNVFKQLPQSQNDKTYIFLNREFIFHASNTIKKLAQVLKTYNIALVIHSFFSILKKQLSEISIPFFGDPLDGLQIMGLMETRLLDFRHVIVLSTNDENLPGKHSKGSFIPYHLRKAFSLPTIEQQDSISAYTFYRLLQRAEKIDLLYNTIANELQTGEPSRFLYQLKLESPFSVIEKTIVNPPLIKDRQKISIEKDAEIMRKLNKYFSGEKQLTATALNDYINCSLKFFYRHIEEIEEEVTIDESMNPLIFGNWFHKTIQLIYRPYVGQIINNKLLEKILSDKTEITTAVSQAFYDIFPSDKNEHMTGIHLLVKGVLKNYIRQLLKFDKQFSPFEIISLEKRLVTTISIIIKGKMYFIKLKGFVDRIDRVDGKIRIIDYKTGEVNHTFKNVEALFDIENKNPNNTIIQTLLYCMLYDDNSSQQQIIVPNVYSIKNLYNTSYKPVLLAGEKRGKKRIAEYRLLKKDFKENLQKLLKSLFDSQFSFRQTTNENVCRHCPFATICLRD